MNVREIHVEDIELDDQQVNAIGRVMLSLVIAHSYMKANSNFEGVEFADDDLYALAELAHENACAAHEQLHEVMHDLADDDRNDWITEGLAHVVGGACSSIQSLSEFVIASTLRAFVHGPNVTDSSPSDQKVVTVNTYVSRDEERVVTVNADDPFRA